MPIRVWIIALSLFFGATAAAIPRAAPGAPLPQLYLGLGHSEPVSAIAWSPDGKTLATGSSDDTVVLWDVAARRPRMTLTGYTGPSIGGYWGAPAIVWSPDGKSIACRDGDTAIVWNAATGRPQFRLAGFAPPLNDLFWSRDGKTLIGFDYHRVNEWIPEIRRGVPKLRDNVVLWDAATGRRRARLRISAYDLGKGAPLSPDGRTLAEFSVGNPTPLILWDTTTWRRRRTLGSDLIAQTVLGWSPDSRFLASLTLSYVVLWDAASGRRRAVLNPADGEMGFRSLAWSPDGKRLATLCDRPDAYGTRIILWDPGTGRRRARLDERQATEWLSWSPRRNTLVSYGDGVVLWNPSSGSPGALLPGASGPVAWSRDGRFLATGAAGNAVALWDGKTGRRVGTLASHKAVVDALAWSPDGQTMAIGGYALSQPPLPAEARSHVVLWSLRTGMARSALSDLLGAVYELAWSPDGAILAAAAGRYGVIPVDGPVQMGWGVSTAVLWSRGAGERSRVDLPGAAFPVAWGQEGKTLITSNDRGDALLWDCRSGERRGRFPVNCFSSLALSLAISPDGKSLVAPSYAQRRFAYRLWDIAAQKVKAELAMPFTSSSSVAWRPDGSMLAIAANDWYVALWDPATGSPRRSLTLRASPPANQYFWSSPAVASPAPGASWRMPVSGPTDAVASLAWRPDGKLLATGLFPEGMLKLWRADSGQLVAILTGPTAGASPLAWSPDGRTLACAYQDHTVILWDPVARKRRAVLRGHTGAITALGWSPDGRVLATASEDGSLRLWSAATGRELIAFYSLDGGKEWLATTPEGYFQASPHGADLIQWRQGGKLWPLERFRHRFERPDLLRRILSTREEAAPAARHISARCPPSTSNSRG